MSIETKALMQSEATVSCSASFKKARWMVLTSAAKELQISDDKAKTGLLRGPISASFGFNEDQRTERVRNSSMALMQRIGHP